MPARLSPHKLRERCAALEPSIHFDEAPKTGTVGSLAELTVSEKLYPPFVHIYGEIRAEKRDLYMPLIQHNKHKVMMRMLTAAKIAHPDGSPHAARISP